MKLKIVLINWCLFFIVSVISAQPIALHPTNPHYFIYKGNASLLVTSAEHYGAVLNPAFDYVKYLNTLHREGMNYTRIFTGSMYWEIENDFGITYNTLAPAPGTALAPWKRSQEPGNLNGGNKFDMEQWDEAYFDRLRAFVAEAEKKDIIVEVTLFTSIYNDKTWSNCPAYPDNNINNTIRDYRKVHTLDNGNLLKYQENFVTKIVHELNEYDNIIYEIQNEPYVDHQISRYQPDMWEKSSLNEERRRVDLASAVSLEWQKHILDIIVEEEKALPKKHLVAQNYCNYIYPVEDVDPDISIINFHYARPGAVHLNYGWNRAIGFDESGFSGNDTHVYRLQAWMFIMAGGALFNNLDYSFAVGYEDGTLEQKAPGGGNTLLRKQLYILRNFIEQFDFVKFSPDMNVVALSPGAYFQALSDNKKQFAIYLGGGICNSLHINLPKGSYKAQWTNPADGTSAGWETIKSKGSTIILDVPDYNTDIALSIIKTR
ncbi:MAG: cellulase family glycosylhydrolase [Proteiniphilum sp.]|uniref:cellulase family glycosylhydrolase n=1 Tax=Proteiniphilum sp. TaxID=1926877 RepID=UPI002AB9FCAD|nr:cellulase family glycosylhydrolase [Proteiniphilum sp.]MDY9919202.1 cellulase family glycosylhydrolase [Proteiniphilum sp.]